MRSESLLLGVDGGGTRCRARLCAPSGARLGEAAAGPANIRLGLDVSFAAVLEATQACLEQAGLSSRDLPRITACLALAGSAAVPVAVHLDHAAAPALIHAAAGLGIGSVMIDASRLPYRENVQATADITRPRALRFS